MRLAVLRASGAEFDVESFVKRFGFSPDIVWRAGKPDRVCRVRAKSGFNLTIADEVSGAALVRHVCEWVETNKIALQAVGGFGGAAKIDVPSVEALHASHHAERVDAAADEMRPAGIPRQRRSADEV